MSRVEEHIFADRAPDRHKRPHRKSDPGILPRALLTLIRSPSLRLSVSAAAGIVLLAAALFAASPLVLVPLAIALGVLIGLHGASIVIPVLVSRAQKLIEGDDDLLEDLTLEEASTGVPELDELVNEHIMGTADLHETIAVLREETEMLLERYEVLTENLAAAIVIRDSEGKIAYCSPYTEVLTGYTINEIYATQEDFFHQIIIEDDREKFLRALKVSTYGEAFQFRYRFLHKTGIEMWAETRTVPILDEFGNVTSSLSITLDVTASERHQKQIEEKNRDLEDFSYMISHDLKAPIFTIKGMLNILREDYSQTLVPGAVEALEHIELAAKRLEVLVRSVLEYSRISTQEQVNEDVDLNTVLSDIKKEYATTIREIDASLTIAPDLALVQGDRLKVYQIFSNLIGNAIKYRAQGRPLNIEVYPDQERNGQYTTVCVRDNGSGIPAHRLEDIFRPFQRAHGKEIEGSGIGLACVKKLLEKLGGEIEVQSTEGRGSEFAVTLHQGEKD